MRICNYLLFGLILFAFCNPNKEKAYSVRDFEKSLQPYLMQLITKGVVGYEYKTEFFRSKFAYADIIKMTKSEHPVLRGLGFRALLETENVDHVSLVMNNLYDTALITIDAGEWGTRQSIIADDLIEHCRWRSNAEKDKLFDEILYKHNNLQSAYTIIRQIKPIERYYSQVRNMIDRDRPFYEIEFALYALAKYKSEEDVEKIKSILQRNLFQIGRYSMRLMEEYPREEYMDILDKYYRRRFYSSICKSSGSVHDGIEYLAALVVYKNQLSSSVLSSILSREPFLPCSSDSDDYLKYVLGEMVLRNKCDAYKSMYSKIENDPVFLRMKKNGLDVEEPNIQIDTVERIRWDY